jgi:hypothetical protein
MSVDTREKYLWIAGTVVLVVFAVPWFMWGSHAVLAGLPVWLWWHVGWMAVAALAFHAFARRAWGLGIEEGM